LAEIIVASPIVERRISETVDAAEVGRVVCDANEGVGEVPGESSSSNRTSRRAFRDPRLTLPHGVEAVYFLIRWNT
jgi:hypothetical protein